MEHLLALDGVSVPVASAILTLLDPRRYGVLDIRAWQLLYAMQGVDANPAGRKGGSAPNWRIVSNSSSKSSPAGSCWPWPLCSGC